MIKFFRKIRLNLLSENKFRNYLLYAIGEIVLVVIGILIALQISDWSENKKRKAEEKKLLIALIDDFSENKARIEDAIEKEKDMIEMSKSLINAMQSRQENVSQDSVRFWVASGAKSWWKAQFITGTYDAIVSSGKIGILENDDLKSILSQFNADINSGFEDHSESMSYLVEMNKIFADIAPFLIHDVQRSALNLTTVNESFDSSINKLVENGEYLGLLISKTWLETLRVDYQQKLKSYVEQILALCEEELKKA
ncbi:MAG: DUF6090 family protein [Bacteroidota bacterium]